MAQSYLCAEHLRTSKHSLKSDPGQQEGRPIGRPSSFGSAFAAAISVEFLGDEFSNLHGIERSALAQIVVADEEHKALATWN